MPLKASFRHRLLLLAPLASFLDVSSKCSHQKCAKHGNSVPTPKSFFLTPASRDHQEVQARNRHGLDRCEERTSMTISSRRRYFSRRRGHLTITGETMCALYDESGHGKKLTQNPVRLVRKISTAATMDLSVTRMKGTDSCLQYINASYASYATSELLRSLCVHSDSSHHYRLVR